MSREEKRNAKAFLWSRSDEVRFPGTSPWDLVKFEGHAIPRVWPGPSRYPACGRHTGWTEIVGCGPVQLAGRLGRGGSWPETACLRQPRQVWRGAVRNPDVIPEVFCAAAGCQESYLKHV